MVYITLGLLLILQPLRSSGQACDPACAWTAWNPWSSCTATCGGGYRLRDRPLCCSSSTSFDACLSGCRLSDTSVGQEYCNGHCYNGAPSTTYPYACDCTDAYYGSCCQDRISCSPLTITNGHTTSGSVFDYGSSVSHFCNEGYNLTDGDYTRTCRSAGSSGYWDGDAPRCAYAVTCSSDPCQNGATCIDELEMYTCVCAYGWTGTHCEADSLPPEYDACPDNITVYTDSAIATVQWTAPAFYDFHNESDVYISAQNYPQPQASLPVGEYIAQYAAIKPRNGLTTECTFSLSVYPYPCDPLRAPTNGSIACNAWSARFTEICMLFCGHTSDVARESTILNVYVCGATGEWLPPLDESDECTEVRSELTASQQSSDRIRHYYEGGCAADLSARETIQQAYLDMLMEHDMAHMCTAQQFVDDCTPDNVDVTCG